MEREWKAYVDEYTSSEILLSNCIAGAAFLTYCGAMGVDTRFVKSVLLCRKRTKSECKGYNVCYSGSAVFCFMK